MSIALPIHSPCGGDGCGELDMGTMIATCVERKIWGGARWHSSPGCGAKSSLCARCGLRTIFNGGPCSACNPNARSAP